MIIYITDTLTYDTDKKFDEQEWETQEYLNQIIGFQEPNYIDYDEFSRETCRYWNIEKGVLLKYLFVYQRPETAWNIKEQIIEVEVCDE